MMQIMVMILLQLHAYGKGKGHVLQYTYSRYQYPSALALVHSCQACQALKLHKYFCSPEPVLAKNVTANCSCKALD